MKDEEKRTPKPMHNKLAEAVARVPGKIVAYSIEKRDQGLKSASAVIQSETLDGLECGIADYLLTYPYQGYFTEVSLRGKKNGMHYAVMLRDANCS